jgi:hypothetical protein
MLYFDQVNASDFPEELEGSSYDHCHEPFKDCDFHLAPTNFICGNGLFTLAFRIDTQQISFVLWYERTAVDSAVAGVNIFEVVINIVLAISKASME